MLPVGKRFAVCDGPTEHEMTFTRVVYRARSTRSADAVQLTGENQPNVLQAILETVIDDCIGGRHLVPQTVGWKFDLGILDWEELETVGLISH